MYEQPMAFMVGLVGCKPTVQKVQHFANADQRYNKNNLIGIALGSNFNGRPEDLIPIIYNMAKNGQLWTIEGNNVVQKPF